MKSQIGTLYFALVLMTLGLTACGGPAPLNLNTPSSAQSSSLAATDSNNAQAKVSCSLSGKTQLVFGESVAYQPTVSSNVATNAVIEWHKKSVIYGAVTESISKLAIGNSDALIATNSQIVDDSKLQFSISYIVKDAAGTELCDSNEITVTLSKPGNSDMNCVELAGQITNDLDQNSYNTCAVNEWTLFRAMSAKNQAVLQHVSGNALANPASYNCISIGGQSSNGTCLINKDLLKTKFSIED